MKILSSQDASKLLHGASPDVFIAQLLKRLQLAKGPYAVPLSSGVQIALSKLFAYLLFKRAPLCLHITAWGVATEHLDLFDGYRRTLGEARSLMQSPFHFFEQNDEEAFISLLCIVLFFSWDASIFDLGGTMLLQTSHDGWLEFRTNQAALTHEVTSELEAYGVRPLAIA